MQEIINSLTAVLVIIVGLGGFIYFVSWIIGNDIDDFNDDDHLPPPENLMI